MTARTLDARLRLHGWSIWQRKRGRPELWRRGHAILTQTQAPKVVELEEFRAREEAVRTGS